MNNNISIGVVLSPFVMQQYIQIDNVETMETINGFTVSEYELPSKIYEIARYYDTSNVTIIGNKDFASGFIDDIRAIESSYCNNSKSLNIKIIEK